MVKGTTEYGALELSKMEEKERAQLELGGEENTIGGSFNSKINPRLSKQK